MAVDVITGSGSPLQAPRTRRFLGKTGEFSLEAAGELVGDGISAVLEIVVGSIFG